MHMHVILTNAAFNYFQVIGRDQMAEKKTGMLLWVLLQNYSEGMEMAFSGNFYAAIGNRSSMN